MAEKKTAPVPMNLETWVQLQTTDPKMTKPITGRQYKGTSVNPTYVARKLTEAFGPAGIGWGTKIIWQEFQTLGQGDETTMLHHCIVELWVRDEGNVAGSIQHMGTTKVAYRTQSGKLMVDDDGPKKSVTDAFVKCASYLGVAGDIFTGMWDDQKYVADLQAQFGYEDAAVPATANNTALATGAVKQPGPAPRPQTRGGF